MGLKQAIGSGNRTLDLQKRSCARPGVRTLDQLKRSFVRSCMRSRNTIAQNDRQCDRACDRKNNVRADARTCSTWNASTGRRTTARPTERWPDRSNFLNVLNILRFPRIMKKDACRTECIFLYIGLVPRIIKRCMLYQMHLSVRRTCTKNLGHNQNQATKAYGRYAYRRAPVESIPQDCFIM